MLGKVEEIRLITECVVMDNREAFGRLVEEYQPELRRFLLNLTLGDAMLADDLAQESFIKAYLNLRSFKGVARFKTWLYRIAYNEFCTACKTRHDAVALDSAQWIATPDNSLQVDASADVRRCFAELSEVERTVMTLFYLSDMPIKRIAQITLLPEATVKSHLSRAKSKMKQLLENDNYDA